MYTLEKIKNEIVEEVNKALESELIKASDIAFPPNAEMGDLSLPLFMAAKELGKNPMDIAKELQSQIQKDYLSEIKIAGPYLNFYIKSDYLAKSVLEQVNTKADTYGTNQSGEGKKVMIEFSNVNTHKQFHVGHLRNISYGDSVVKLLAANGYDSIPVSYVNDFGIHVAKTLWAYKKFFADVELPENKGEFLGKVYVKSSQESKENEDAKVEIEKMMKGIESMQGADFELWQKTRQWSVDQFAAIYEELNVPFEKTYYEHEYIKQGREIVTELLEKGILKQSEGAIIADLEEYNLGVLVMLRSDGTATYPVADLALILQKIKDYDLDESIYIVDVRQSLYFKQLFKLFELSGVKAKFTHLGYDFVKLPSGMMSSRSGNTVTHEELVKKMLEHTSRETKSRHEDWSDEKVHDVAMKISLGAIKFEMLKVGSLQEITFDIEKALSFSGYTSAYLQYTYARINSIIKKSEATISLDEVDFTKLSEQLEHDLVLKMAKFPEAVKYAGEKYDLSVIAKYLFELAQTFNDYYHSTKILKSEEEAMKARLALISEVNTIIKNGLAILGIDVVSEM